MYAEIPLWAAVLFVAAGLAVLAWSADRFVAGSAALAKCFGVAPFVIGMVVIGFGTSAPELIVSVFSGASGHSGLSLGNAYGSCIFNIAFILGVAALIKPVAVKKSVVRIGVPLLVAITAFSRFLVSGDCLSRKGAAALLAVFAVAMPLYCFADSRAGGGGNGEKGDGEEMEPMSAAVAAMWAVVGLAAMIGSSHLLVWGAVDIAKALGVSELVIGLTVVAMGTSLPELASAVAASRRGESELVLGNVIGSNIFNMLAVVGIAGVISPMENFSPYVVVRDMPFLFAFSLSIAVFGFNFRDRNSPGRISRFEGGVWLVSFFAYMALLFAQEVF